MTSTDIFDALGIEEYRSLKIGFDIQEDSMNVEIQEGLKKKLPSHLEIKNILSRTKNEPSNMCTTRSLYMAGFLKGFAESGDCKEIPFFMGRAHLPEVKAFLTDTNGYAENTEAFKTGNEMGSLLAKNLLISQKEGTEAIVNTITAWNPKSSLAILKEVFSFSDAEPSSILLQRPFLLGFVLGLTAQTYFIYNLCNIHEPYGAP